MIKSALLGLIIILNIFLFSACDEQGNINTTAVAQTVEALGTAIPTATLVPTPAGTPLATYFDVSRFSCIRSTVKNQFGEVLYNTVLFRTTMKRLTPFPDGDDSVRVILTLLDQNGRQLTAGRAVHDGVVSYPPGTFSLSGFFPVGQESVKDVEGSRFCSFELWQVGSEGKMVGRLKAGIISPSASR